MTTIGKYDMAWKAARARRALRLAGDSRTMTIEQELSESGEDVFVLHAGVPMGTDVPVSRDAWPGLDTEPQDAHGGEAA